GGIPPGGGLADGATGGKPVDAGAADGPAPVTGSCGNIVGDRHQQVCLHWTCDRADRSEGTWSGSLAPACDPGDISAAGRNNALKLLNMYRFLADLPSVTHDATLDQNAQSCALMMH